MGQMIARMLAGDTCLIGYTDNAEKKQGTQVDNVPVFTPQKAVEAEPDLICLGVLDAERAGQMEKQLKELGYGGEVIRLHELELFDSRIGTMRLLAEEIRKKKVPGAAAELGVFQGVFARQVNLAFPDRELHLYDTFQGFAEQDLITEQLKGFSKAQAKDFSETSEESVYKSMPIKQNIRMHPGYFPDSFHEEDLQFCFVSLDPDLYEPTKAGLENFWPRLAPEGVIMVHDYSSLQFRGVSKAVDGFLESVKDAVTFPVSDVHGSLVIKKMK